MANNDQNSVSRLQDALSMLRELDSAQAKHLQWLKELHRVLICGQSPRPADISADPHLRCPFGKWYYGLPAAQNKAEFKLDSMEVPHQKMHEAARQLLLRHQEGKSIAPGEYEQFMDVALEFKMSILGCQNQIIGLVCTVDHLTGAWNRHAMSMRLNEEYERARRGGAPCCLCLLDLDHFKQVNDQHGHGVGDSVLQSISRFLKDRIRPYDSFFRYGGEEFLICLPNTTLADAALLLNRLREELAAHTISACDGQLSLQVTASFGVALLDAVSDLESTIECVDHALLCAKAKGRNQVCSWDIGALN